jgi:hypothetical protein
MSAVPDQILLAFKALLLGYNAIVLIIPVKSATEKAQAIPSVAVKHAVFLARLLSNFLNDM